MTFPPTETCGSPARTGSTGSNGKPAGQDRRAPASPPPALALLPSRSSGSGDGDAGFCSVGCGGDAPASSGPSTFSAALRLLIRRFLAEHPRERGYSAAAMRHAFHDAGHAVNARQMTVACSRLCTVEGVLTIVSDGWHTRCYRLVRSGEAARFTCSRAEWPILLALAAGRCANAVELQQTTGQSEGEVKALLASLCRAGAAHPDQGLPRLNFRNPQLRALLQRICAMLHPALERTPLPKRPQPAPDGPETLLGFLESQPPQEWFTGADLQRRFLGRRRHGWARRSLQHALSLGWIESRGRLCSEAFRLRPGYRDEIAQAAAGVNWAAFFRKRDAVGAADEPGPKRPRPSGQTPD
ncbi:hypothetical protein GT347_17185 [Xylophilus rhododendri]|uniref:Uncharacterized protein n=1 Tax=Xylophilus rhododendri TaxID=2697032 RepID=A0A857J8K3_9BURK|nr:hypothetical protein [Xylophilus rhododendri]QHI99553.1 hypothetical protein GT347_17185 [Xylophilus rhododendri]